MTMQDPIADMLTRIRNAQGAGHATVTMPASKQKKALLDVLVREGYVANYTMSSAVKPKLTVTLKYQKGGVPVIEELKRVSRPGLRIYKECTDLPKVRGGLGVAIISTDKGLLTDRVARSQGVGGEVICTVF
ncbi:MAG: 30S ribosomal protein S8 [Gammaproteobacteria bacterium]|nr:30S ribosomal protein S8 [Gammaproteobacteria bacterium]